MRRVQKSKSPQEACVDRPSNTSATHELLQNLFLAIAPVLLESGITAHQINEIAKDALLHEAANLSRMASGRVNHSKVAALIGMTRADIRRRLHPCFKKTITPLRALDRSSRVVAGWIRDPTFHDSRGKPKTLAIRGTYPSFADLVRRHSGDVPPRAVLETLKSRGIVVVKNARVQLTKARVRPSVIGSLTLLESAPYVNELLRSVSMPGSKLNYAHQLSLYPRDETRELMLTNQAASTLAAAISALSSLPEAKDDRGADGASRRIAITVTLVSTSKKHHGSKKEKNTKAKE